MRRNWIMAAGGLTMLVTGVILAKLELPRNMEILGYVLLGLGCGIFGGGTGGVLSDWAVKKNPEAARLVQIAEKDERNVLLADQAKARAFDGMLSIFGALMLVFVLMQVELRGILLLVAAYLTTVGIFVVQRIRLEKML